MEDTDSIWGSDAPISMPAPANKPILITMGTMGFTEDGLVHDINRAVLEEYIPTFMPQGGANG